VTRRADEILKEIEKEAVIEPLSKGNRLKRASRYTQLIFFEGAGEGEKILAASKLDPILEEIMGLDLDSLTPREALNRLAEYQKRHRERNGQDQTS
jgi:DNA mismatch repair protein MutS